jgi:hypothetical protein
MDQEIEGAEPNGEQGKDDMGMEVDNPTGEESSTALLPTDFFQGKELTPGTVCKVKISRVLNGQVEVEYVPHDEVGGESEPDGDEEMEGYMNT